MGHHREEVLNLMQGKEEMTYLVRKAWKMSPDIYVLTNLQMDNPKVILLSKDCRHMWLQWNLVERPLPLLANLWLLW